MPKKIYPDYQEITADNFEAVMQDHQRLVYKWLWKSKSSSKHWPDMIRRFWEQVWINRGRFDRKRGKVSTWLEWQWKHWKSHAARASKRGYQETPLCTGDYSRQMPIKPNIHHVGLDPQTSTVLDGWVDSSEDGENKLISSIHHEAVMNADPEALLVLRDMVSRLSEDDQHLIELRETGCTIEQIAKTIGITAEGVRRRIERVQAKIQNLMGGRAHSRSNGQIGPSDGYWEEYFKQMLKTWPLTTNKYEDAREARGRSEADRIRDSWSV